MVKRKFKKEPIKVMRIGINQYILVRRDTALGVSGRQRNIKRFKSRATALSFKKKFFKQ